MLFGRGNQSRNDLYVTIKYLWCATAGRNVWADESPLLRHRDVSSVMLASHAFSLQSRKSETAAYYTA